MLKYKFADSKAALTKILHMLRILNLPYLPKKETMDFLKNPQVWYMPLHAGIVLYGLYCAELVH